MEIKFVKKEWKKYLFSSCMFCLTGWRKQKYLCRTDWSLSKLSFLVCFCFDWEVTACRICPFVLLSVPDMNRYFQPFYQPNECGKALCVRPDVMELDELYEFPEYSRDPTMYLALRNLILALWYTNCKVSGGHVCQQHMDRDFC